MRLNLWPDRSSAPLLGLDASAGGIKLVELSRDRGDQLTLERCGLEPLEREWIKDGSIENFDGVVEATRRLIRRTGATAKRVAMALPSSEVISKRVILPAGLSEREMEVQVESEAHQYVSYPLDEVSLDFCVLGPSRSSPADVEVLIAATRREKVEDRQGLAEAVGLTPVILDVENYAAQLAATRLIARQPGMADAMIALIGMVANSVYLQVLRGDEMLYERDYAFGGMQLTQMLMLQYGYDFKEAQARQASGELPDDYLTTVMQPYVESVAPEIERALRLFFTSTPHHRVDHILLAGEVGALAGLPELVAQHSGTPCSVANPFEGMQFGRHVRSQLVQRDAPVYLTACGLALRRFLQ